MIPQTLIDKALALTNTSLGSITENCEDAGFIIAIGEWYKIFSIEKFYAYLLSPDFIEKFIEAIDWENNPAYCNDEYPKGLAYSHFGVAIGEHQAGNEQPMIELLSNI